jgi:hypothetical protein
LRMKPLVLEKFGSGLSVKGFHLIVSDGGEKSEYEARRFPFDSVYFLTHTGNISLEALHFATREDISIFTMNFKGELESAKGAIG